MTESSIKQKFEIIKYVHVDQFSKICAFVYEKVLMNEFISL